MYGRAAARSAIARSGGTRRSTAAGRKPDADCRGACLRTLPQFSYSIVPVDALAVSRHIPFINDALTRLPRAWE